MEQIKTNLDQDFIDYVSQVANVKSNMAKTTTSRFLVRAMLSGVILTFMYLTFYSIEALFAGISSGGSTFANLGIFYGGWVFAFALVFIYYTKSELLTSNMMVMSVSRLEGKSTWGQFGSVLSYTYLGNALGSLFVAILIAGTTIISPAMQDMMVHTTEAKLAFVQNGTAGYLDLFIRAIWCNFFINLGMLPIYGGTVKSDFGKIIVIFGAIFIFMRLGLEHSVANTAFFILVGITGTAHVELSLAIPSLIIALIGNFIGGGLFIGATYAYLNRQK